MAQARATEEITEGMSTVTAAMTEEAVVTEATEEVVVTEGEKEEVVVETENIKIS